jgi:hypothetical protein
MTIKVIINDVYYDISSLVQFDTKYSDDISKELDLYSFIIPVCKSDSISGLDLSLPFTQNTRVEIDTEGDIKRMIVREDDSQTVFIGSPKLYSHKVSLIEHTKILELKTVPDSTVTQPQGSYTLAVSELNVDPSAYDPGEVYVSLSSLVENNVPLINTTSPTDITYIDGTTLKKASTEYTINSEINIGVPSKIIDAGPRTFKIRYKINGVNRIVKTVSITSSLTPLGYQYTNFITTFKHTTAAINEVLTVTIEPLEVQSPASRYDNASTVISTKIEDVNSPVQYLDEVIDKALESVKLADINDLTYVAEFTLADDTRNRISNIVATDDTFERNTVWEIIESQANLVKAIPRLSKDTWNEITFDFIEDLTETEYVNLKQTEERKQLVLDKFSTALEINADNVIESIEDQAIKVEPYENGWMTLRSTTDGPNQLTDVTIGLKVRSKIYKHKKLLAKGFTVTYSDASSDGPTTEWDISPYVVEEQKWGSLKNLAYDSTSDRNTINLGKGNTIYYTKSGQRLLNFGYRAPKPTSVSPSPDQAIYQIIASIAQQETGKTVTGVNGGQSFADLLNTQYRDYYSAFKKVRMKVYKHNARDFETETTLYSNEQAKVNDNVKLGRYNQSLVNKSGNLSQLEAGVTSDYDQVPRVGQIMSGNKVITKVDVTCKNGLYEYGIASYVDYAELSKFVSVNSEYRQWQISDKDIVERILVYEDCITVGRVSYTPTHTPLTNGGITLLSNPFTGSTSTFPITYHQMKTRNEILNPGDANWEVFDSENEGPVDIVSLGTSTLISVTVKDNYSIDDTVEEKEVGAATPKWYQNNQPYTNTFGQYNSARYEIYSFGTIDNDVDDGNAYPAIDQPTVASKAIELDIRVKKDSREATYFGYQIPFFSKIDNGVENFRVYNGMAKYNGFAIQDLKAEIVPVLLLDGYFPTVEEVTIKPTKYTETTMIVNQGIPTAGKIALFYDVDVPITATNILFTGWGLIEKTTGELIYMAQEDIQSNDTSVVVYEDTVYMTPDKRKGK